MPDAGLLEGLYNGGGWRNYRPLLRAFSTTGSGVVQPILSDPRFSVGRYIETNQGLVRGWAQIQLQAGDALGSGESVWGVSLPKYANRSSGGADLPIGDAFLWQGAAANPSVNLGGQVTLLDPLNPAGSQGEEDHYCQVFLSKLVSWGTAAMTSGVGVATVTHGCAETPSAYDIKVVPTNNASTNPQWWWVDTIGATTFNINVKSTATTTPATFAWKIEAEPNNTTAFPLLMSSLKPWAWAAGHSINIGFEYEPRR